MKLGTPNTPAVSADFTDRIVFNPTFASQIIPETCRVGIDFRYYCSNCLWVFNVKLPPPKAFKNLVVISTKLTLALSFSPQHANRGERRIPYFARAENYETALSGLSSAVHVRVAHSAPLVGVPVELNNFAPLI